MTKDLRDVELKNNNHVMEEIRQLEKKVLGNTESISNDRELLEQLYKSTSKFEKESKAKLTVHDDKIQQLSDLVKNIFNVEDYIGDG